MIIILRETQIHILMIYYFTLCEIGDFSVVSLKSTAAGRQPIGSGTSSTHKAITMTHKSDTMTHRSLTQTHKSITRTPRSLTLGHEITHNDTQITHRALTMTTKSDTDHSQCEQNQVFSTLKALFPFNNHANQH